VITEVEDCAAPAKPAMSEEKKAALEKLAMDALTQAADTGTPSPAGS
jgi:hypothetical protein